MFRLSELGPTELVSLLRSKRKSDVIKAGSGKCSLRARLIDRSTMIYVTSCSIVKHQGPIDQSRIKLTQD